MTNREKLYPSCYTQTSASDLIIAEYNILRSELTLYHEHQKELINYSLFTIFGLLGALLPVVTSGKQKDYAFVILFASPIIAVLGLMYTDRTIRILRIAHYIHNYLRPKACSLIGSKIWQWEIYKRYASPFPKQVSILLDRVRWILFVLPGILSIILFVILKNPVPWNPVEIALFVIAVVSPLSVLGVSIIVEETSGIRTQAHFDLDKLDDINLQAPREAKRNIS